MQSLAFAEFQLTIGRCLVGAVTVTGGARAQYWSLLGERSVQSKLPCVEFGECSLLGWRRGQSLAIAWLPQFPCAIGRCLAGSMTLDIVIQVGACCVRLVVASVAVCDWPLRGGPGV